MYKYLVLLPPLSLVIENFLAQEMNLSFSQILHLQDLQNVKW